MVLRRPLKIAGASMGDCVHVAGVLNFLRLAEDQGYDVTFLGPAKSPEELGLYARENRPDILAVGYRLDPVAAGKLIERLRGSLARHGALPRLVFGGTPPVAEVARASGLFEAVFSGLEDVDEIIAYLKGEGVSKEKAGYPHTLIERIQWKSPYPLLRHHFGLASLEATIRGIERISDAKVLDVISLGPDQNAQENFFHPEDMDHDQDGAGGVPVRSREDFERLYLASRRGNYPLMRCYSGTRDVVEFASLLNETIHNAWAAIPLCWYNILDGRGPRQVVDSIREGQKAMAWHAQRDIPVEVNEAHHWSLRDAPDVVAVAAAYLAAYNAKAMGVKDYVAQFMFNTPPGTSAIMDLGKMLAKLQLIRTLEDSSFRVWVQVRAGLSSFPPDLHLAKGHLSASTLVSMNLKPHIVHVVGFCEADHASLPEDVIESSRIARGVIRNVLEGMPDMTLDERVQARKEELLREAKILLHAIQQLPGVLGPQGYRAQSLRVRHYGNRAALVGKEQDRLSDQMDPLVDPVVLAWSIRVGLLDAPHLAGNPWAPGKVRTRMVGGCCLAVDPETGETLPEEKRVARIMEETAKMVQNGAFRETEKVIAG